MNVYSRLHTQNFANLPKPVVRTGSSPLKPANIKFGEEPSKPQKSLLAKFLTGGAGVGVLEIVSGADIGLLLRLAEIGGPFAVGIALGLKLIRKKPPEGGGKK
jgi:hypothetical protein